MLGTRETYAAVGAVCAAALLGGLVDLDVLDDQVAGVETLGVGVGLSVLEETEEELGRLDGPAGARDTPLLACLPPQSAPLLHVMSKSPSLPA
jgi:hypothetical protein